MTNQDVIKAGYHPQTLARLVAEGAIERVAPGQYRFSESERTEQQGLVVVAAASPKAVICLLSALSFHQIGTQVPAEVWVALERRSRAPRIAHPPLRVVRFSGKAMTEGIEKHRIDGQVVRIYGVAKTIADCFKYRNKIGLDVGLEALKDGWRKRRFTIEEIEKFAKICRVERVMRPYLEVLVL